MMKRTQGLLAVLAVCIAASGVWAADQTASVATLKKRAAQGEVEAQFTLGVLYSKGEGVPQDETEALKWFRLAAAQGHARAQLNLGLLYATGEGVPQDEAEALKWFRLAAAQGEAGAQFNLGVLYYTGEGVPQDDIQAYKWFHLAAASFTAKPDQNKAGEARNRVAARMTPAQITEAQKLVREWKKP
jgi:uncharacterized protein